jgi:hypothetical protein
MDANDLFDIDESAREDAQDIEDRDQLARAIAAADSAIDAGIPCMVALVWRRSDGTVGKIPGTAHGHIDAHCDKQRIRAQLATPYVPRGTPDNYEIVVAMCPGPGGYVVLDADVKHGKGGRTVLANLDKQHGPFVTSAWKSPSGGVNVLLRKPVGAQYGNASPWASIDIRADAGWVVAPGQRCAGGEWRWIAGGFESVSELPGEMAAQLSLPTGPGRQATNSEMLDFIGRSPEEPTLPVANAFGEQLALLESARNGSRHSSLMSLAGWCGGMNALPLRWALDEIQRVWLTVCPEVERRNEPLDVFAWVVGKEIDKRGSANSSEPEPEPDLLGDADKRLSVAARYVDWNEALPPTEPLVEGLIESGLWTQFVAGWKVGKSTFVMFAAIQLSRGVDPLDGLECDPVSVLWLDGEMGLGLLQEAIEACGHEPGQLANLHCSVGGRRLDTKKKAIELLEEVEYFDAKLVVLDGLNKFVDPKADENDANTWTNLYTTTVQELKARGIAVVSCDNLGKSSKGESKETQEARGSRGSSAKNDVADALISMRRITNGIQLTPQFGRGGKFIDQAIQLGAVGFDRSEPIRYWRSQIKWSDAAIAAGKVLDRLGAPLKIGRPAARKLFETAGETVGNAALSDAIRMRKLDPKRAKQP